MVLNIAECRKRIYLVVLKDLWKDLFILLLECSMGNFHLVFIEWVVLKNIFSQLSNSWFYTFDIFFWNKYDLFLSPSEFL